MSACLVCNKSLKYHRPYDFRSPEFKRVYAKGQIFRCSECNLSQIDIASIDNDDLTKYYKNDYRVVGEIGAISDLTKVFYDKRSKALLSAIAEYHSGPVGKVFEIGAGYCYNLLAVKKAYPDAEIFTDEISESIEIDGEVQMASLEKGEYDVIILSHVLEHFTNPEEVLRNCKNSLSRNGTIIIEVPNDVDNIVRYNVVDEPHITFFEKDTLNSLLQRQQGLHVMGLWTAGPTNRPANSSAGLKKNLGDALRKLPIFSSLLQKRAKIKASQLDFENNNEDGFFLRAALSHKEES